MKIVSCLLCAKTLFIKVHFCEKIFLSICILSLISIAPVTVFAQADITKLMSPKYDLEIDGKIYQIYYGYKDSIEGDFEEKDEILPEVTSMSINAEKKSLEITLKNFERFGSRREKKFEPRNG